jgi:hypothetical protein
VLKGSETHENGNSRKRWVFEYLHMHTLEILFVVDLVVGFICLLFKFHGISETFQNLGLEKVGHSVTKKRGSENTQHTDCLQRT